MENIKEVKVPLKLDFKNLRKQKEELLKTVEELEESGKDSGNVMGVIHLIDYIQDYAVDESGVSEKEVFGELE